MHPSGRRRPLFTVRERERERARERRVVCARDEENGEGRGAVYTSFNEPKSN